MKNSGTFIFRKDVKVKLTSPFNNLITTRLSDKYVQGNLKLITHPLKQHGTIHAELRT